MDVTAIIQAISVVGFPIVMCIIMFWYVIQLNTMHKEESNKFADALNNNTLVLQKLCDKLDMEITNENKR